MTELESCALHCAPGPAPEASIPELTEAARPPACSMSPTASSTPGGAAAAGRHRPGWCASPISTTARRTPCCRTWPRACRHACCRPRRLDRPRRELDEYFGGRRHTFELPLDWQLMSNFGRRVLEATARSVRIGLNVFRSGTVAGSPAAHVRRQRPRRQPASDRASLPPRAARGRSLAATPGV